MTVLFRLSDVESEDDAEVANLTQEPVCSSPTLVESAGSAVQERRVAWDGKAYTKQNTSSNGMERLVATYGTQAPRWWSLLAAQSRKGAQPGMARHTRKILPAMVWSGWWQPVGLGNCESRHLVVVGAAHDGARPGSVHLGYNMFIGNAP